MTLGKALIIFGLFVLAFNLFAYGLFKRKMRAIKQITKAKEDTAAQEVIDDE